MPWLASMLAALTLLYGVYGGGAGGGGLANRLQTRYPLPYDESVPNFVKRCNRYLNAASGELLPDCLDEPPIEAESAKTNDEVAAKRDLDDLPSGSMLNALFGRPPKQSARPTQPQQTNSPPVLPPHQLPPMYYSDFYYDLLATKRNDIHSAGCDCKVTNELLDLGNQHFPRYLMNAVCESRQSGRHNEIDPKCTHGSNCRPLEYNVKVLTRTEEDEQETASLLWTPRDKRQLWKFRTITVTAGCFCAK